MQRYPLFELALTRGANGWHDLHRLPGVHYCSAVENDQAVNLKVMLQQEEAVGSVVQEVLSGGSRILSLNKVEPTLEDVFVNLVGHQPSPGERP